MQDIMPGWPGAQICIKPSSRCGSSPAKLELQCSEALVVFCGCPSLLGFPSNQIYETFKRENSSRIIICYSASKFLMLKRSNRQ